MKGLFIKVLEISGVCMIVEKKYISEGKGLEEKSMCY